MFPEIYVTTTETCYA